MADASPDPSPLPFVVASIWFGLQHLHASFQGRFPIPGNFLVDLRSCVCFTLNGLCCTLVSLGSSSFPHCALVLSLSPLVLLFCSGQPRRIGAFSPPCPSSPAAQGPLGKSSVPSISMWGSAGRRGWEESSWSSEHSIRNGLA